VQVRLEHLPADIFGLSPIARRALTEGMAFGPLPLVRRISDVQRPSDRHDPAERGVLARKIRQGLAPLEPPERVQTSLNLLEREGVFAVVTGQQPGFLCSPLYSLYKAMQACRLAYELSSAWGSSVIPVFWNHADDHDIAEVHHAFLLNRNLDLQKVGLAGMSSGRVPIGSIYLDEERHRLEATRELIAQQHGEHPFCEEALELFFPRAGETLAGALTRAFTELLGEHGLVVVEPDWIREPMSQALADIVGANPFEHLVRGTEDLRELGLDVGIDPGTAALVYRVDEHGRHSLRSGGEGFQYDGEPGSRTPSELAAEIVGDYGSWSPAALLRPLVQDSVFPVAAYVGGYGELAYLAELARLRAATGVPRTPFVPRVGCTLVDDSIRYALERVDTDLKTLLRARGSIEVETGDGPPVLGALRSAGERAASELLALKPELLAFDRALGANLKRTADQVKSIVEKLVQKGERVHANSSGKGRRQLRRLQNTLVPRELPQERVLGPFAYTARFGRGWIESLYAELPALSSEHLLVHLVEPEESET